mgnify:CR=1 FL=1
MVGPEKYSVLHGVYRINQHMGSYMSSSCFNREAKEDLVPAYY